MRNTLVSKSMKEENFAMNTYLYRSKHIGHVRSCSIFSRGFSNSGGRVDGGVSNICRIRSSGASEFNVFELDGELSPFFELPDCVEVITQN